MAEPCACLHGAANLHSGHCCLAEALADNLPQCHPDEWAASIAEHHKATTEPATLQPNGDLIEPIGTTRDRLLTTSDGRQYVSRSYGPWEAVAAEVMPGQEALL